MTKTKQTAKTSVNKVKKEEQLTLTGWDSYNEEQREMVKAITLKSLYGKGGEHFSTFPTVLDLKQNPWTKELRTPGRVRKDTLKQWEKENGTISLLNIRKGTNGKNTYLIIIRPEKQLTIPHYDLEKEDDTLTYTKHKKLGNIRINKEQYHITNSYSNIGKTTAQIREISKTYQLGIGKENDSYTHHDERVRAGLYRHNILELNIDENGEFILNEIGKNSGNPTGKTYRTIGEYLGRTPHKQYDFSLKEINSII